VVCGGVVILEHSECKPAYLTAEKEHVKSSSSTPSVGISRDAKSLDEELNHSNSLFHGCYGKFIN